MKEAKIDVRRDAYGLFVVDVDPRNGTDGQHLATVCSSEEAKRVALAVMDALMLAGVRATINSPYWR